MTETDSIRVAKGSAYLVAQSLVVTIISGVGFAFIARILTETEMGVTVGLLLIVGLAEILSDLGFSSGLAKYIAEYRGRNEEYTPVLFTGTIVKLLVAGAVAVFTATMAQPLSIFILKTNEHGILFQMLSIFLMFTCMNITLNGFLLGLNKMGEIAILGTVSAFARQVFIIVFLIVYGLPGLVTGWIIGALSYTVPSVLIILKGKHIKKHSVKVIRPYLKTLVNFSWPLFLANTVLFAYNWFDRAMLLAYVGLGEVAVYNVAFQAFTVLSAIPVALNATLLPYYSQQYGRDEQDTIVVGVRVATRYLSFFYTPLAIGLAATANPTITLFAGTLYSRGDVALAILSFFGALTSISATIGVLLLVYNMTPAVLVISICMVCFGIVASPVVLPSLGIVGMVIIKGVAMVFSFVFAFIVIKRRVAIEFDKEAIWKSWSASAIMFVAVWLMEWAFFSRYLLPLYIVTGGIVYMAALRILKAVDKSDIQLLRKLIIRQASPIVDILERLLT